MYFHTLKSLRVAAPVFLVCLLLFFSVETDAQQQCSDKRGNSGKFSIRNDLDFDVVIKFVRSDCKEDPGTTIGSGRALSINAFDHYVFRVYESLNERFLTDIILVPGKTEFFIKGFEKSEIDPNAKVCSKQGGPRAIQVRNATDKSIEIRLVDESCTEQPGPVVTPGKQLKGNSFVNTVLRVYDNDSKEYISQIIVSQSSENYLIGGYPTEDLSTGFLNTVNAVRKSENLKPAESDETLTKACRWFADFMAEQDEKRTGSLVSDFTKNKELEKYETAAKRLEVFGAKKGGLNFAEVTAVQMVGDNMLVGSSFAVQFTANQTYQSLFYGANAAGYDRIGFAASKSKKYPDTYYGCAIFVKR